MIENAYYSPEVQGPYEMFDLGDFTLEEGPTLRGCQLAYATFGELNDARDNAVLVTTWYSGTHQIFADAYIGSEHALDPEKYFIVVANQIGNGLSTSPHNTEGPFSRGRFPHVRIGDDARPGAVTPGAVRHRGVAARDGRLDGGATDLRMGGAVPG